MKTRQAYQIGDRFFKTKGELTDFVKGILNKYELNDVLNDEDFSFISKYLTLHPEYEKKVGCGLKAIIIKRDGNWGKTRCFHIVRTDETQTDFSYLTCLNHSTSREPLTMFKKAARSSVKDQVLSYLTIYNKKCIDKNSRVICEKTKKRIPKANAQVDHIPPRTFDKIVTEFLKAKNLNLADIEYDGFGDNEYTKQFKNKSLAEEFSHYHKQVARLRVISKHENLTQKKKGFSEQLNLEFDEPT